MDTIICHFALLSQALLTDCRDLLSDWLDAVKGSTVTDKVIFADLARHFEAEYHSDMQNLNVSLDDVIQHLK